MAQGLALSLEFTDSKTHRVLMTDHPEDEELCRYYDEIIPPNPKYPHWFSKLALLEMTDADAVMFVDGDCLAVRNPDSVFDRLQGMPFAVQGEWTTEDYWYGDFGAAKKKFGLDKAPIFIGGWLYYERGPDTVRLIEEIMKIREMYDTLGPHRNFGEIVDEICISLAMAKLGIGTVLPSSADISVTTHYKVGPPVKFDLLRGECTFVEGAHKPILCKPVFYHSAMARYDLRYWVQMKRLMRLYKNFKGWPHYSEPIRVKLWRRLVWWTTTGYVKLMGLEKE